MKPAVKLPIELIPNSRPPRFRWTQLVGTPVGPKLVHHEGSVPPELEIALVALYQRAIDQDQEIVGLRHKVQGMTEQLATQTKTTADGATQSPPQVVSTKKNK